MGSTVKTGKYAKFLVYLLVVVLVNVAGITLFYRLDLTADRIYSLSEASRKVVSTLSQPLTINVFFTKNLPAPYNGTERYLRDLLEEYAIYASKYFNYRFYDVSPDEGDLSPGTRSNQELARNYGISPIQIQVIEEDEVRFQKAYMGLVIIHGDLIERIPTLTSIDQLEYQLTTAIMKLNNKISALLRLPGKIQIKLYLSSSLKSVAPMIGLNDLSELPKRVGAIIDRLNPTHFNKLEYTRLDPSTDPAAARDLRENKVDILSLRWPDLPQEKIAAGEGSIGLVFEYGKKRSTVQLVNVLRIPIIGTRYEMVNTEDLDELIGKNIESLIDINQEIGYLADKGTLPLRPQPRMNPAEPQDPETLNNFRTLLSQTYTVRDVRLAEGAIPSSLRCLVVARPTEAFSDFELYQIDQYLIRGGSLVLIPDSFNEVFPQQQQMPFGMNAGPQYIPIDTGLEKLLEHYGIRVRRSYVMDKDCYKQELPERLGGGERPIYFAPLIQNRMINHDPDFMRNINRLVAVRISPLELVEEGHAKDGIKALRLFSSSDKSWEMRGQINLNPNFIVPPQSEEEMQSYPLAYILAGTFTSYFEGKPLPEKKAEVEEKKNDADKPEPASAPEKPAAAETNRPEAAAIKVEPEGEFVSRDQPGSIFLMASAEMLSDNVIDAQGRGINAVFLMNVIDALNGREDLAVLRGKKQEFNPLSPTDALTKTIVKASNVAGLPILVTLFGVVIWLRRIARKRRIKSMFENGRKVR